MRARGEAFESMMLVVSVIIALAILSLLAALIAELQAGVTTAPDQAMHDALKPIVSSGFGSSSPQKTVLWKGASLDMRQVVKNDLPELNPGIPAAAEANARFCVLSHTFLGELVGGAPCSATFSTNGRSAVYGGTTRLGPQTASIAFYFVACGDSTAGSRGEYMITIAGTAAEAGRNCYLAAVRNAEPPPQQPDFIPLPPLRARQPQRSVPPSIEEQPRRENNPPQGEPERQESTASVRIEDEYFSPRSLTVSPGTVVTWTHLGLYQHTVTFNDPAISSSGNLNYIFGEPAQTHAVTFNTPGSYTYYCSRHRHLGMTGTITVRAPSATGGS